MMCPKCHCVDSHAAYCEDRATKDAPIKLPPLPLALTHLSAVKKRWCREWAEDAVLADRAAASAEPPAAPMQQEPVAFMGRAPGWRWDFEPGDSGPDPTWTECYPLYTHPSADLQAELAEAIEAMKKARYKQMEAEQTAAEIMEAHTHCPHCNPCRFAEKLERAEDELDGWNEAAADMECLMKEAQARADKACAERDALKAELAEAKESAEKWKALAEVAQQGWEISQRIDKRINAMRAQASTDAVEAAAQAFEAMHKRGDLLITTISAAHLLRNRAALKDSHGR